MYPRLFRIAAIGQSGGENPSPLHLLALPRPTSYDPTVLTLLITSVTHALNALISLLLRPSPPFSTGTLVTTLQRSHSLLAWAPNMKRDNVPDKTRDAVLTKAYTFINKVCTALSSSTRSSADHKSIFQLRMYGLSCLLYATPGSIKSATFWDQVHQACLSYARTQREEEEEIALAACVSDSLSEVVRLARSLHERAFSEGRSFVQMCETWMRFARRVSLTRFTSPSFLPIVLRLADYDDVGLSIQGDLSILDHVSELMGIPRPSSSSRSNLDAGAPASNPDPLSSSYSVDSLAARVGQLKLSESTSTKGAEPTSHRSPKDAVLVECAQCCGIFVKATASLDSEGKDAFHRC